MNIYITKIPMGDSRRLGKQTSQDIHSQPTVGSKRVTGRISS
ncbi:hypothetical protein [Stenotrophomonas sp.]|nr:hypothetical protein [Stenotrophomonas sp.]